MITIDKMESILDELAGELPKEFYSQLNGGIVLLPQAKLHPQSKGSDLYTMGEYYQGGNMGRYIAIYYGSFARVYGYLPEEQIKIQLRKTLRHEFRHHLESLAGEKGLQLEDEKYIEDYMERYRRTKQK